VSEVDEVPEVQEAPEPAATGHELPEILEAGDEAV
jgi:hypothetical protein